MPPRDGGDAGSSPVDPPRLQAGQCPAEVHTLSPPGATPGPATAQSPADRNPPLNPLLRSHELTERLAVWFSLPTHVAQAFYQDIKRVCDEALDRASFARHLTSQRGTPRESPKKLGF